MMQGFGSSDEDLDDSGDDGESIFSVGVVLYELSKQLHCQHPCKSWQA